MNIGLRIAERRRELHMTQQELAEALGVSFQAVSAWERGEYLPETRNLEPLANALSWKISALFGQDPEGFDWPLEDEIYSAENTLKRVRTYARDCHLEQTLLSLRIMETAHSGRYRKSKKGEKIPYIVHPLTLACHAMAMNIADDTLLSACLLHDVLEDCPVTREDLAARGIRPEILDAVELVSFAEQPGKTHEEAKAAYYARIAQNKTASMVKVLDRCNNISTMATAFSRAKMADYILETERFVLPILDRIKHQYDDYNNAAYLIKYHMVCVMESLKRTL